MSNQPDRTARGHVPHPELWTLELSVRPAGIDYMLHSEAAGEAIQVGSIAIQSVRPDGGTDVKAVENAVYDNEVLLDDYRRVRVLVASPHFVVLPPDTDDDDAERLLRVAYPETASTTEAAVCRLPLCGQVMAFEMETGLRGFLDRTFNTPQVCLNLYPLCEHYYRLNNGSTISRMFLNLRAGAMDIAVYRRGELLVANSYRFTDVEDAAFFALHVWQSMRLDQQSDEIQLAGSRELRDELATRLKRYVRYVMPAIYPAAALRIGRDMSAIPFDLILFSQCE